MGSRNVSPLEVAPRADRELGRELRERLLPMLVWAGLAYLGALGLHGILLSGAAWWEVARRTLNVAFSVTAAGLFLIRHPVLGSRAGHWRRSWPSPAPSRRCSSPPRHPHTRRPPYWCSAPGEPRRHRLGALGAGGPRPVLRSLPGSPRPGDSRLYRIVRHPHLLRRDRLHARPGPAAALPDVVLLLAGWIGCQIWRTENEERALLAVFPEYRAYRSRTRRLIPFLW